MALRNNPEINIWYGDRQRFGFSGRPQRWVNILGDIGRPDLLENLTARVNGGEEIPLSVGPDGHRLAAAGGALLIAHYSVVTFGNVSVLPM